MKLTEKAKEQFEKWYLILIRKERKDYLKFTNEQVLRKFYRLLPSQQWGTYQDWADSLGYDIYFTPYYDWTKERDTGFKWYCAKRNDSYISETGLKDTIQEARNAAINKLNELINEK